MAKSVCQTRKENTKRKQSKVRERRAEQHSDAGTTNSHREERKKISRTKARVREELAHTRARACMHATPVLCY